LPGPAFFPEGFGLSDALDAETDRPTFMAIGHNFGCAAYREKLEPPGPGREDLDGRGTWCKLDGLLRKAGANPALCFRTNWFIGLLPGQKQSGPFLLKPDPVYEVACCSLLAKQIRYLRPAAILLLGPYVASRACQIISALTPWRGVRKFSEIDCSSIGHSPRSVEVTTVANFSVNVAALLHPSIGAANQGRRVRNMPVPMTEAEIIRTALRA
jgi:hypothetical protein